MMFILLLSLIALTQGCKRYQEYVTDMCQRDDDGTSFKYTCQDSTMIMESTYTTSDCTGSSTDLTYDCSQPDNKCSCSGSTCKTGEGKTTDCGSTVKTDYFVAIDDCITDGTDSMMFTCSGTSTIVSTEYSSSDCTGVGKTDSISSGPCSGGEQTTITCPISTTTASPTTTAACDSSSCRFAPNMTAMNKCGYVEDKGAAFKYTCKDMNTSVLLVYPSKTSADCTGSFVTFKTLDCRDPDNGCNCKGCTDCDSAEFIISDCKDTDHVMDDVYLVVNTCFQLFDNGTDGSQKWDCVAEDKILETIYGTNDCTGTKLRTQVLDSTSNCTEILTENGIVQIKSCTVRATTTKEPGTTEMGTTESGSANHKISLVLLLIGVVVNQFM